MKTIVDTLTGRISALLTPWLSKLRALAAPAFWTKTLREKTGRFFTRLFNVKPRDRQDYYPLLNWLISKRLAFAAALTAAALSLWYIAVMSPAAFADGGADAGARIPAYRYDALPLKFYRGEVRILARDKQVAYAGHVSGGRAEGMGRLYGPDAELIYEGRFENSQYEGEGRLYYPDGALRYAGGFSRNLFDGQGAYYRPGGTLAHRGGYAAGLRSGLGELYNPGGNRIFTGAFSLDEIVYTEFIGKTAPEAAAMYTGASVVYRADGEYCVAMTELDALYALTSGENTLTEEWRLRALYLLRGSIRLGGRLCENFTALNQQLGQPDYTGYTWVTLADAAAVNRAAGEDGPAPVDMTLRALFDDVYEVTAYDYGYQLYIRVYKTDGLAYTFFSGDGAADRFFMYAVEPDR